MLAFDPRRVQENVRKATTVDLLDRVTVYRAGMEPEAIEIIEGELQDRGVYRGQIEAHAAQRQREQVLTREGIAVSCSFCYQPAVAQGWGWHWLSITMGGKRRRLMPLFPRFFHYCAAHRPGEPPTTASPSPPP
jgi:hypothetical protein